ncbi:MAG: biotin carboxylase N-terminal domain-containing protein, partial [Burkholderiaceae bacterium]
MSIQKLLIANRGEISIRIARACAELGIATVAVYSEDDAASLHVRRADDARPLSGVGAAPYLDIAQIVEAARAAGCDAIHPGYGFLSENADFARACAAAGILFVGPAPEVLELFGDKAAARKLAESQQVPVVAGTGAASLEQVRAFMASLGPDAAIMIKALAGGGGRGMRAVHDANEVAPAYALCQAEAQAAFGNGALYAEQLVRRARHIEIQVIGDGSGAVSQLGERECTLQRRNQKLIEIAPSPSLAPPVRARIADAALRLAAAVRYRGLGTFEFLLDADAPAEEARFTFMEANPRLQVEHTVTEEVTGVDLVKTQLLLAQGKSLAELNLTQAEIPAPHGFAMQLRINMETMNAAGEARPAGGTLAAFEPPSGPGIRVDSFGYAGYTTSPHFDSLLAKLIVHVRAASYAELAARAYRALCEFRVDGVATNIPLLQALLGHPAVVANDVHTRFVEDHIGELLVAAAAPHRRLYVA